MGWCLIRGFWVLKTPWKRKCPGMFITDSRVCIKSTFLRHFFRWLKKKFTFIVLKFWVLIKMVHFFYFIKALCGRLCSMLECLKKSFNRECRQRSLRTQNLSKARGHQIFFWTNERTKILQKLEHQEQLFKS